MLKQNASDIGKIVKDIPIEECRYEVPMEALDSYFYKLASILPHIDFRYCYNVDETGEDEFVDARKLYVYVPADFPDEEVAIPVKRGMKRFTIVHSISSGGRSMPLYYIVPRKTMPNDVWQYLDITHTAFRTQPKGFMTESLFRDYFENHFLPNLFSHRCMDAYWGPALLLMDNLLSHKKVVGAEPSQDLIYLEKYNLYILFLVPHSSDQTQPLDLGIFGNHKAIAQRTQVPDNLSPFTKRVIRASISLEKASTTVSIINAFAAAGIVRMKDPNSDQCYLIVDRSKCTKIRNDYSTRKPVEWEFRNEKIPEV